jgi:APA family basic amino acid/polyamine antiporter
VSTIVASALMGWSYSSQTGLDVFTDLVYLSVVTVAIPDFIAAAAQFTFLVSGRRRVHGWSFARDMTIADVGLMFSLWVTFSSGYAAVYQALLLVLVGIPLYGFLLPQGPPRAARPDRGDRRHAGRTGRAGVVDGELVIRGEPAPCRPEPH